MHIHTFVVVVVENLILFIVLPIDITVFAVSIICCCYCYSPFTWHLGNDSTVDLFVYIFRRLSGFAACLLSYIIPSFSHCFLLFRDCFWLHTHAPLQMHALFRAGNAPATYLIFGHTLVLVVPVRARVVS